MQEVAGNPRRKIEASKFERIEERKQSGRFRRPHIWLRLGQTRLQLLGFLKPFASHKMGDATLIQTLFYTKGCNMGLRFGPSSI